MNEALAIEIATRYVKEYEPSLNISLRKPSAMFDPTSWDIRRSEKGAWTVQFGVPSPYTWGRRVSSHYVTIDRLGRVCGPPMTMSP